jgi:CRISPR-associated protein Csx14
MSLLAISVASLNFDCHDHIWHIYTPEHIQEQVKDGRVMHVPPDAGVRLIKGQFLSLGAYIYNPSQSFRIAQEKRRFQMDAQEHERCAEVEKKATPAQLKVLQAFAKGLRPQQIAEELSLALVTVHTHKTALLGLCHNAWNIPNKERLDYHFLRAKFATYFQSDE